LRRPSRHLQFFACDKAADHTFCDGSSRPETANGCLVLPSAGVRDSTYVLDGLLHHESDLRIEEHYTDTAGFTDHVFALMHLLGFRFAPRIRDLSDIKLYLPTAR
jgi:Tn3 transposase DDE domain